MHAPVRPFEKPEYDAETRSLETRSLYRVFAVAADLALLLRPAPTLELPPTPPAPTPEQQRRVAEIFAGYGHHFVSTAAYGNEG